MIYAHPAQCGVGCTVAYLVKPVLAALKTRRHFVTHMSKYASSDVCEGAHAQRMSCFFAPFDKCGAAVERRGDGEEEEEEEALEEEEEHSGSDDGESTPRRATTTTRVIIKEKVTEAVTLYGTQNRCAHLCAASRHPELKTLLIYKNRSSYLFCEHDSKDDLR